MVFTMSYCILGMTLLSMCMSLMQEQITEKVNPCIRSEATRKLRYVRLNVKPIYEKTFKSIFAFKK